MVSLDIKRRYSLAGLYVVSMQFYSILSMNWNFAYSLVSESLQVCQRISPKINCNKWMVSKKTVYLFKLNLFSISLMAKLCKQCTTSIYQYFSKNTLRRGWFIDPIEHVERVLCQEFETLYFMEYSSKHHIEYDR